MCSRSERTRSTVKSIDGIIVRSGDLLLTLGAAPCFVPFRSVGSRFDRTLEVTGPVDRDVGGDPVSGADPEVDVNGHA
jgi:hypothetical protein